MSALSKRALPVLWLATVLILVLFTVFIQSVRAAGGIESNETADAPATARLTIAKETDPDGGTGFPFTLVAPPYSFDFKFGANGGDGTSGNGTGEFDFPYAVDVDAAGNIYVADTNNSRIQKFDSSGGFLAAWGKNGGDGSSGSGDGEFNFPSGVAVDASGNIYVADTSNYRVQMLDSSGNLVRMWGWGVQDGSPAFQVCTSGCQVGSFGSGDGQFFGVIGLDVDSSGIVTVVDSYNFRLQQFDSSDGSFLRMWGWGVDDGTAALQVCTSGCQAGSSGSGDGQFNYPGDVAVDGSGNLFVIDTYNNRVQKFDSSANFVTKWGTLNAPPGDFFYPNGVAVDATGNVYVADGWSIIQKFDNSGTYLTQLGSYGTGDGELDYPYGVAVDASGNVIVSDTSNNRIQVFAAGPAPYNFSLDDDQSDSFDLSPGQYVISETVPSGWTLAGIFCGGDPITDQTFVELTLAVDDDVTCVFNNKKDASLTIAKVTDPAGGTGFPFTVDPGHYLFETKWGANGGDGSLGAAAGEFQDPWGITLDEAGNVYIVDSSNNRIQKLTAGGSFLMAFGWDVVASGPNNTGTGFEVCTPADTCKTGLVGTGDGQFDFPSDLGVDAAGNIYVADYRNERIQVFDSSGNFLFKWGKNGGDGTVGFGAGEFFAPSGVAFDAAGNVYVGDSGNNRIQKFTAGGSFLMAFGWDVVSGGGTGLEVCLPTDTCKQGVPGTGNGQLEFPAGLVLDAAGNIYVGDVANHRIQVFDSSGGFLTKWGKNGGDGTGSGNPGEFWLPYGVTLDAAGNVYVADTGNHRFQKFDSSGNFLNTFGSAGTGDGQFDEPYYLAVDAAGKVYMTDAENNRVQIITHELSTVLDDGQDDTFTMEPGTYLVSELVPDGWTLSDIDCGGATATESGNTVEVTLAPDEHATCTFTNTQPTTPTTGTIEIIKSANPSDDTVFSFTDDIELPNNFTLQDPTDDTKTFNDVPTGGSYTVTETDKPGWPLTALSCSAAGSSTFDDTNLAGGFAVVTNLDADDTVTCTFTNTQCQPGNYDAGGNECVPAPAGSFVPEAGATEPTECLAGTWQDQEGADSCKLAEPGFYVPEPGAIQQLACPAGTTSEAGATECFPIDASNTCPVDPTVGSVNIFRTNIYGVGMGSPQRVRLTAKLPIPNAGDTTSLYGQMAARTFSGVRYVRFMYPKRADGYVQVQPETDLGVDKAISWWGDPSGRNEARQAVHQGPLVPGQGRQEDEAATRLRPLRHPADGRGVPPPTGPPSPRPTTSSPERPLSRRRSPTSSASRRPRPPPTSPSRSP